VDAASRRMIATEVRARLKELTDIANRRDANSEYLFSGHATLTQPFTSSGGAVSYFGDQGERQLQIGPDQRVGDSHSGFQVFMNVPEGNGVFATNAAPANTGTGVIAGGSVFDLTQWTPDDYTLRFTSANGDYEIIDGAAAVAATGVYTNGDAITFNGVSIEMSGAPALNDEFTISRSRTEDIFTTIDKIVAALEAPTITAADRAQFGAQMASALQQLEQTSDHLLQVRAEIGSRLSSLETAQDARADHDVELKRMASDLRDLDYAEAIARMNQQLVGLEAAQASYSRISQLSLFDYLR
jgi:flagellar hook-associated protein 3 FlgL